MKRFPAYDVPEFKIFKKLTSPAKIQDFLETLPINFKDTFRSPKEALRHGKIQCLEGATLAAAIFWYHGRPPLLLDLETTLKDESHVVALFKENGCWGAVSKTNHAVLRYRDPIYKTIRELALSYFNEYFLDSGVKTLRSYSTKPFDLTEFDDDWLTATHEIWGVEEELVRAPHTKILGDLPARKLRPADPLEIRAGKITEWKKPPR